MKCDLTGTDEPVFNWEYAGSNYRLSIVGGLVRLEQQLRGDRWYLIEPGHDTTSMMVCAQQLVDRLRRAELAILHLKGERFNRKEAVS
jgi:hypothetical protein